eukprot:scaffold327467_cov70-Tisochrysis_lutea.AAC.1
MLGQARHAPSLTRPAVARAGGNRALGVEGVEAILARLRAPVRVVRRVRELEGVQSIPWARRVSDSSIAMKRKEAAGRRERVALLGQVGDDALGGQQYKVARNPLAIRTSGVAGYVQLGRALHQWPRSPLTRAG